MEFKEPFVFTIGHSTRKIEEFIMLLKFYKVEQVVDIRRFPVSKKFPWFSKDSLKAALEENNIKYEWLGDLLGGYRKGGYEKYMETSEFKSGIEKLKGLAKQRRTAILCAELLWFRCHRRFVADRLEREGWAVYHIYDSTRYQRHPGKLKERS